MDHKDVTNENNCNTAWRRYTAAMANTNPKVHDRSFTFRTDAEFLDALDELRSLLKPVPSKSDALRQAVFHELQRVRSSVAKK